MSELSHSLRQQPTRTDREANSRTKKILHVLAVVAISLAGAFIFTARVHPATMDYISYWSAGKLLIHHADPYSPEAVLALEKPLGFMPTVPLVMRNPPWALFLVVPLGLVSARTGLFLWTLITGLCIIVSVRLLSPDSKDTPLALLFAPAIACISSGQTSPFLLLGFALFVRLHRNRPFLAGAFLLLMAIKPHLFLVFWTVLLVDCIYRRQFSIFAGGTAALLAASGLSMCFDAHIWPQYLTMLRTSALHHEVFPTASMIFRLLVSARTFSLVFVPSCFGVLWALWYSAKNRQCWDWRVHGMLLMLITILVSPYGWITDEIVLLPSIIFALSFPKRPAYSGWALFVINGIAAALFMVTSALLKSPVFLWTPVAWLAWFLYATSGARQSSTNSFVDLRSPERA